MQSKYLYTSTVLNTKSNIHKHTQGNLETEAKGRASPRGNQQVLTWSIRLWEVDLEAGGEWQKPSGGLEGDWNDRFKSKIIKLFSYSSF